MHFMDFITIISAIASVAGLFGSQLSQFSQYRKWLTPFGTFFLGLLVARLIDAMFPSHNLSENGFGPRQIAIGILLVSGVSAFLITLIREKSQAAVWVLVMLGFSASTLRFVWSDENPEITLGERLAIVSAREKASDFDGAIKLLKKVEDGSEKEEREAIEKRISELQSEKLKNITVPVPNTH